MAGMLTFTSDTAAAEGLASRFNFLSANTLAAELVRQPVLVELQRETPVSDKVIKGVEPGTLRDTTRSEVAHGPGMVVLRYLSDQEYAGFVIDGTAPHEITPRDASVLHWVDPSSGEDVFRHRVWHPGTQPNDYPGRTAARVMPLVESAFGSVFERF